MLKEYIYDLATDKRKGVLAVFFKFLLLILSFIYGAIIRILIVTSLFRRQRLNCKVISIGNITLGGTGKTSLVEFLGSYLKEKGYKVAVLSRGYKSPSSKCRTALNEYEVMGDEPFMLKINLKEVPVIADKNRMRAAKFAIREYGVSGVILDDGFQQWRIQKDLEIVTIDATKPFGNLNMLPRGILREPLSSLKRADILVLTKTNLSHDISGTKESLLRLNPCSLIVEAEHSPWGFYEIGDRDKVLTRDALQGKSAILFSGIADPASFENLVRNLGIKIGFSFKFPDHHHYAPEDLTKISKRAQDEGTVTVITTEKDAVKIKPYVMSSQYRELVFLALRIQFKIVKNEDRFLNRLLKLFSD